MVGANREQLYFEPIKENRGPYFVEYQPPVANNPFATLSLVYPGAFALGQVGEHMRLEMRHWLLRYPVPVLVTAFDAAENILQPNGEDGSLVGWFIPGTNTIASSRKLDQVPPFINDTVPSGLAHDLYRHSIQNRHTSKSKRAGKIGGTTLSGT